MDRFAIKSRKLGKTLEFSRPGVGYIYVDLSGDGSAIGTLGKQICRNGGSTASYYGEDEKEFASICRAWYRSYVKDLAWRG